MWELTGAEVVDMGVRHHDAVLAATSHLPHMLAYTLVDTLARLDDRAEIFATLPVASAISAALRPATRKCGTISVWPTVSNCWR